MMMRKANKGSIEVIVGPMYSGKSEELIKRIKIYGYAGLRTLVCKPALDTRWADKEIISRAGSSIETKVVRTSAEILKLTREGRGSNNFYEIIAIDEAQFMDEDIVEVVTALANSGKKVIVSALDMDFRMQPFGMIPQLLAVAEKVDKLVAVCMHCGDWATTSYRVSGGDDLVLIGSDEYEARCRECHLKGEMGISNKLKSKMRGLKTEDEFVIK